MAIFLRFTVVEVVEFLGQNGFWQERGSQEGLSLLIIILVLVCNLHLDHRPVFVDGGVNFFKFTLNINFGVFFFGSFFLNTNYL